MHLMAWLPKEGIHGDVLMQQLRVDGRLGNHARVTEAGLATRARHFVLRARSLSGDPPGLHAHAGFVQHEH